MKSQIILGLIFLLALVVINTDAEELILTTTKENPVASKATINMAGLAANPQAIFVAAPLGETALFNPHPIGISYLIENWINFDGENRIIPFWATYRINTNSDINSFIPVASNNYQQEFILTTTKENITVGVRSLIDIPGLSGNLHAIIVATPVGDTEQLNPHPVGAWYYGEKWFLFNSDWGLMPPGAKYRIQFFSKPGPNQFIHTATKESIDGEGSYIDHPALNNNPNAQVKILQNHAPDYRSPYGLNAFEAKAAYSSAAGRWYIANTKGEAIKINSSFNVVISSGGMIASNTDKPIATPTKTPVAVETPTPKPNVAVATPTQTPVAIENQNPKTPKAVVTPSQTPVAIENQNPKTPKAVVTPTPVPLVGFVDMHTHPMSNLAFGGKLMHGAPDIGMIIPAGTFNCNPTDSRAKTINEALGNCNSSHGGWNPINNGCADNARAFLITNLIDEEFLNKMNITDHHHEGIESIPYPFLFSPHQSSKVHQQMWWEWIKRAKELGNLRVMVALTVNNEMLANVLGGSQPKDDKASSDLQIDEIKSFVGRHNDFMEIAYNPADLRRIVNQNKLAVILGMEVDNVGNFNKPGVVVNEAAVKAEITRLHTKGVRYIFPIHLVNNQFGGTAVYEDMFNISNKISTGNYFNVRSSTSVKYRLGDKSKVAQFLTLSGQNLNYQDYGAIPNGHLNTLGLTDLGKFAVLEMMKSGMIIDIDHMSDLSQKDTLDIAERLGNNYPVTMGHNGFSNPRESERHASEEAVKRLAKLGGVFGVGTSDSEPHHTDSVIFINRFKGVQSVMNLPDGTSRVAIGTDVNGMERLPRTSPGINPGAFYLNNYLNDDVAYLKSNFLQSQFGPRKWDYAIDGVAHYGLMADFMRDVRKRDVQSYKDLMKSAEYFAQMWEQVEKQKASVQ